MSDVDTMQALDRIDRALGRIEAIDLAATPAPALAVRHDRLRAQIEQTIARLDALIGEDER